jgi:hypothetical protein
LVASDLLGASDGWIQLHGKSLLTPSFHSKLTIF